MRKYVVVILALIFIASAVIIAYAGHERVIPWESSRGHYDVMPLPDGGDLRHHIAGHSDYKTWKMWPGKGELYKGKEPHGSLLTTYVNDRALKSIDKMKGMANNSIIVKENYAPNAKLMAVTVMYKVKGYNPEGGDWFWAKYSPDMTEIMAQGKVSDCLGCHSTVKNNDYVFAGPVK